MDAETHQTLYNWAHVRREPLDPVEELRRYLADRKEMIDAWMKGIVRHDEEISALQYNIKVARQEIERLEKAIAKLQAG